jgi:hypothetical protein
MKDICFLVGDRESHNIIYWQYNDLNIIKQQFYMKMMSIIHNKAFADLIRIIMEMKMNSTKRDIKMKMMMKVKSIYNVILIHVHD